MNLVLIGYRGSGKTTIGRVLAERMHLAFVDTDAAIVAAAGRSIADVFATEGEAGFRAREREAIAAAVAPGDRVVSVGGGAVEAEANRALLRASGRVVWLSAPPEVLWSRIAADPGSGSNRPDLAGGGLEEVETVLARRTPWYAETAHVTVDVSHITPETAAEHILSLMDDS